MPKQNLIETWTNKATAALVGRTIKSVRYLTKKEAQGLGWGRLVLVIELDDGTILFPSKDDEGNEGGAMFGQDAKGGELTFPVIPAALG